VELLSPPRQDRWEALHRLRIREVDVPIESVMRKGAPAAVILDVAREVACDLIVMGVPRKADEALSGLRDVAAEVVGKSPCPVLTLSGPPPLAKAHRQPTATGH
jgi:nucleotide-binding universal stress UspA family protein